MKKCRTSPPQSYAIRYPCSGSPGLRFLLRRTFSAQRANGIRAFVHAYSRGKTAPDLHRLPLSRHCHNCGYDSILRSLYQDAEEK